jgi:hypothetical protein
VSGLDAEVAVLLRERPDLLAVADAVEATQAPARRRARPARLLAIADGRVLHAVVESPLPGTSVVDLRTGARTPVEQQLEWWYDARRGELRSTISIGGRILAQALRRTPAGDGLDPAVAAFATRYREALGSGEARDDGRGTVGGRPVVWLRFPDVGLFGERVGVDATTYRPVVVAALDAHGRPVAPVWHVHAISTLPRRAADFAPPPPAPRESGGGHLLRQVAPARAASLLGWTPLWLGSSFGDLPPGSAQLESLTTTSRKGPTTLLALSYGRGLDRIMLLEGREPGLGFRLGAPVPETELGVPVPRDGRVVVHVQSGRCDAALRAGGLWVSISNWQGSGCLAAARALRPIGGTR